MSLTNSDIDGRILLKYDADQEGQSILQFMLLNPERHFSEILTEARSVVLAGGTLQPISDFTRQLIAQNVPLEKIEQFSCGHVIPKENLVCFGMGNGPSGRPFDFTFRGRTSPESLKDLGNAILSLCQTVPQGVVCFYPSYQYEDQVYKYLKQNDVLTKISKHKLFLREGQQSTDLEKLLTTYHTTINSGKGAFLSCVVGGKLSEGINFSDGLGRCVAIVGLPFPNPNDPILKEKIKFIETLTKKGINSHEFQENMCMRGVNQSIGRAIRHKADYAAIVLLDQRYAAEKSSAAAKLPGWIRSSFQRSSNWATSMSSLASFFSHHNKINNNNKNE